MNASLETYYQWAANELTENIWREAARREDAQCNNQNQKNATHNYGNHIRPVIPNVGSDEIIV